MGIYNEVDIAVSPSGDLLLASNKDFSITSGSGVLKQDISFRLRTDPGEFYPHPELGAGLGDLIGEPNSRETCKDGESRIASSLINDGMISSSDLYVRGVPISLESLVYYVFVNNGSMQINVSPDVIFNTIHGFENTPGE
jgi:hypothetical protein